MPLNFEFSEEQELFRRTVREFAKKEIAPKIREYEKKRQLIGEENRGFHYVMETFDLMRALIAIWCVGLADSSLEEGIEYEAAHRIRPTNCQVRIRPISNSGRVY